MGRDLVPVRKVVRVRDRMVRSPVGLMAGLMAGRCLLLRRISKGEVRASQADAAVQKGTAALVFLKGTV